MAACMRFAGSVSMGMDGGMRVYTCMHSRMLTDMDIDWLSGSVGSMGSTSRAMCEISQQRSYNEVYQPNQEASNKHK